MAPEARIVHRLYRPEDREQIFRLWTDFIAPDRQERRQRIFDHLIAGNPARAGRSPYHLVVDGDEIVAQYGRMPIRFMVNGALTTGYVCHDIYVHRRYRGKARGLSDALVRELEEGADSFVLALWFAPFNYGLHRRLGWTDLPSCPSWVKVYDPRPFLRGRVPASLEGTAAMAGSALLRGLDVALPRAPGGNVRVELLPRFDERFDQLAAAASAAFPIIAYRDRAYLDWKYGSRPCMSYQVLAALEGERLLGYLVFRVDRSDAPAKGLVVDFLTLPSRREAFQALVVEALYRLKREEIGYAVAVTTRPELARVLRRCGFLRSPRPNPVMISGWEGRLAPEQLERGDDWYLTRGDGDGDFWTTD